MSDHGPERNGSLVSGARSLREWLIEEQPATEERGYCSDEIYRAMESEGFFRALQPAKVGGEEAGIPTFLLMVAELARGCPSTAWSVSLGAGSTLLFASMFSGETQRRAFATAGSVHGGGSGPAGTAKPIDGGRGYRVSGTWRYCSGAPRGTYFLALTRVEGSDGSLVDVAMPRSQYEIEMDTWGNNSMLGLNGSASHSITIRDVTVSAEDVIPIRGWSFDHLRNRSTGTVGYALYENPMYLGYCEAFNPGQLAAVHVGTARAAIDEYERVVTTKGGPFGLYRHDPHVLAVWADAVRQTDAAEALMLYAADWVMMLGSRWEQTGELAPPADVWRAAGVFLEASRTAWRVLLELFHETGAGTLSRGSRMQRYLRDLAQARPQGTMIERRYRDVLTGLFDQARDTELVETQRGSQQVSS